MQKINIIQFLPYFPPHKGGVETVAEEFSSTYVSKGYGEVVNNKAIFLDRDGTLNYDSGYTYKIEELRILPGVKDGLKKLKELGFLLIVITNQSGIGRGYYTKKDFFTFMQAIQHELGLAFDDICFCPHTPEQNCDCRKPQTKLIDDAMKKFGLIRENCYFIGDKKVDIEAGKNAGMKTVYVGKQEKNLKSDFQVETILEFSKKIG